jgi:hypothetical protein
MLAQIPPVMLNIPSTPLETQKARERFVRQELFAIIGSVWPAELNPPSTDHPPVAGPSTSKRNRSPSEPDSKRRRLLQVRWVVLVSLNLRLIFSSRLNRQQLHSFYTMTTVWTWLNFFISFALVTVSASKLRRVSLALSFHLWERITS